jgi:hypothetical protein
MKTYRLHSCTGDRWGGEFCREPFRKLGITYNLSDRSASEIYRDSIAAINSGKVELLEETRCLNQLAALERRIARSGHESISHPAGQHDDCANSAMGALMLVTNGQAPMRISEAALASVRALMPDRPRW